MTQEPGNTECLVVGLAQISPVWLDREATLAKVCQSIDQAAAAGCRLVVFGESLVPGYPFWLSKTGGAAFDNDVQKEIFAVYLDQAVDPDAGHLDAVAQLAGRHRIEVLLGCFERARDRSGHTGYCSLIRISAAGKIAGIHRKLVPTYEERLVWGSGDGHGLQVFPLGEFTVGGLNCWENWMPMARSALHGQGEDLHVAVWPGGDQNTRDITRWMAMESRSYVLSVSGTLTRDEIPDQMPHRDLVVGCHDEVIANGGSCIAAPDGSWVAEPADRGETLIVASLDPAMVRRERQNFDPSGHYSRPDVLQLAVNRQRQSVLKWVGDQ